MQKHGGRIIGALSTTSTLPPAFSTLQDGRVRLAIHAKPGAKSSGITEIGETVGVRIAAPPRDGEANEELISFFSKILGLKKKEVYLEHGTKSREKCIVIENMTADSVFTKLSSVLEE